MIGSQKRLSYPFLFSGPFLLVSTIIRCNTCFICPQGTALSYKRYRSDDAGGFAASGAHHGDCSHLLHDVRRFCRLHRYESSELLLSFSSSSSSSSLSVLNSCSDKYIDYVSVIWQAGWGVGRSSSWLRSLHHFYFRWVIIRKRDQYSFISKL